MDGREHSLARALVSLWFKPGAAIDIVRAGSSQALSLLLYLAGTVVVVIGAAGRHLPGLSVALGGWGATALVGLVVFALAGLFIVGWLIHACARALGGTGSPREVRTALAWGSVPGFASAALDLIVRVLAPENAGVELGLGIVAVVCSVWSLVLVTAMLARVEAFGKWRALACWLLVNVVYAAILAVLVRSLALQPFYTPSAGMEPSLRVGDSFFASKYPYGYDRYSFPLGLGAPLGSARLLPRSPELGDIVVFRFFDDDFVKRVVGLPGDTIQMRGDRLIRNGVEVPRRAVAPGYELHDSLGRGKPVATYVETIAPNVSYSIVERDGANGALANTAVFTVPEGACFVLGDNRDNSSDSRTFGRIGDSPFVSFDHLVARAEVIYYSVDADNAGATRAERVGRWLR